ncbi:hypothetical protein [Clostridium kluyveri]|uniref:VCBS repeat-containing protein n=1 Tax=Clostridium kluyveri TaxID=1534 RepID=A0A1L5F6A0_CLOKL|nr:hypothetical protein [Clostridium kluyveri]APM38507.1 hypothetical protein BS101_07015 [Clostridium kluyveri]UZQ50804.1 hypothetical protein OP486_01105 [Clostridium kluyveri]
MKIQDSSIQMSSQHSLVKAYQKVENLNAWEDYGSSMPQQLKEFTEDLVDGDKLELSDEAQDFMEKEKESLKGIEGYAEKTLEFSRVTNSIDIGCAVTTEGDLKLKILEDFLSAVFKRKIRLKSAAELNIQMPESIKLNSPVNFQNLSTNSNRGPQLGWGFQYNLNESYLEKEKTSFKSSGLIHTADGKEINFDIELNMSRSFYTETNLSLQAGDKPIDPLVINFDGKAAELNSTKFSFDLDSDGKEDQISSLKNGSGFLSLDLNGDGVINDGRELFGPNSGNGFEDLAKYDSDHNNWIDENDDIFNKLRIWTKDEEGNDKLFALGEKGIGAIYLGNIGTEFSMKDTENKSLAEVRNSGIFVGENGTVGTVQQIDFIV